MDFDSREDLPSRATDQPDVHHRLEKGARLTIPDPTACHTFRKELLCTPRSEKHCIFLVCRARVSGNLYLANIRAGHDDAKVLVHPLDDLSEILANFLWIVWGFSGCKNMVPVDRLHDRLLAVPESVFLRGQ